MMTKTVLEIPAGNSMEQTKRGLADDAAPHRRMIIRFF
jgi:hypothetical protein